MKYLRWSIPAIALLFLSGCFQISQTLHVNPDGSGTVELTMLLSKTLFSRMGELLGGAAGGDGAAAELPMPDLYNPDELRAQASQMGEGVSFRSGKKLENADFSGFTAVYAFTDINKLNLNLPGAALGLPPAGDGNAPQLPGFHFKKGSQDSPAKLTFVPPAGKALPALPPAPQSQAASTSSPPAAAPEEAARLARLFKGMKFRLAIDVNGSIISTNAAYRDGNRITVLDFDLDKLVNSPSELEKLNQLKPGALGDARGVLKEIPGVKVDMNDTLKVVFR